MRWRLASASWGEQGASAESAIQAGSGLRRPEDVNQTQRGERPMNRMQIRLAFLIACLLLSSAATADAQRQRYRPTSPPLSPYFDLFRGGEDAGPLGGYWGSYRPRQDFRRAMQQQGARLQQQATNLRALDQRMSLTQPSPGSVRPTGSHSVFMNYSHYYPLQGRSGSSGGRRSWSPSSARSGGGYGSSGGF